MNGTPRHRASGRPIHARWTHLLLPVLLSTATPAYAHAFLQRSNPPVGSDLPASPSAVTITYTEGVEPDFSTIEVQNAQGARVDEGHPHLLNGEQRKLSVNLPKLPPGKYTVTWHVTSVDTHKTEGRFHFTVGP
ncbi:MAG TPA: copper resistance protein CopC [Acetobacteraceae bacterium]